MAAEFYLLRAGNEMLDPPSVTAEISNTYARDTDFIS